MFRYSACDSNVIAEAQSTRRALRRYVFSPWGHSSQPEAVQRWGFPVSFQDAVTGKIAHAHIRAGLWERHTPLDLHYPVPFNTSFDMTVTCMEVRGTQGAESQR